MKLKVLTVAVALGSILAMSCEKQAEEKQIAQSPEGVEYPVINDPLIHEKPVTAHIELDNGNKLFFVTDEEKKDVLVLEEHDCVDCSAIEFLGEKLGDDMTTFDVFWAFSEAGAEMPEELQIVGQVGPTEKANVQGWARNEIGKGTPSGDEKSYACNNSNFASGSWLGGSANYIRYDKRPNEWGGFYGDCWNPFANGTCQDGPRYRSSAGYNGVTAFRGRLCSRNRENANQDHYLYYVNGSGGISSLYKGPCLTFTKRASNGNFYAMTINGTTAWWEVGANQLKSYTWWVTSSSASDFRAEVRYAKRYDEFDILVDK